MFKLFTIIDSNTQNGQATANSSYYVDLAYDLVHDSIEFINYLHMIFYSQLAVTFCCLFLIIQAKQYYTRISTKIQKHWQHQEISRHINSRYDLVSFNSMESRVNLIVTALLKKNSRIGLSY